VFWKELYAIVLRSILRSFESIFERGLCDKGVKNYERFIEKIWQSFRNLSPSLYWQEVNGGFSNSEIFYTARG